MYLYGRSFTLRTDHQALTTLMSSAGTGHRPLRLHRWADRLNQYNYQLLFTPGKDNVVADFLSCSAAEPTSAAKQPEADIESDLVQLVYEPLQAAVSLEELKRESAADPLFVTLSTYIQNGWPARVSADLTPFSRVRAELTCWGESCIARGHRAVIPLSLRGQVLSMAHEGHVGVVKLKQRCRDLVWWPGIDRELEALVRDCAPCLLSGKTGAPAPPPLQPVDWPTKPWEHLQMDLRGARLCSSPSAVPSCGVWPPLKVARGCAYGLSYSLRNGLFSGATVFPMGNPTGHYHWQWAAVRFQWVFIVPGCQGHSPYTHRLLPSSS